MNEQSQRPLLIPLLIAGVLSLVGIANLPYGYYEFLRWILSVAGVLLAIFSWKANQKGWLLLAIPVFILWFPPFQIFMDKSAWAVLDLIAGLALIWAGFSIKSSDKQPSAGGNQ